MGRPCRHASESTAADVSVAPEQLPGRPGARWRCRQLHTTACSPNPSHTLSHSHSSTLTLSHYGSLTLSHTLSHSHSHSETLCTLTWLCFSRVRSVSVGPAACSGPCEPVQSHATLRPAADSARGGIGSLDQASNGAVCGAKDGYTDPHRPTQTYPCVLFCQLPLSLARANPLTLSLASVAVSPNNWVWLLSVAAVLCVAAVLMVDAGHLDSGVAVQQKLQLNSCTIARLEIRR